MVAGGLLYRDGEPSMNLAGAGPEASSQSEQTVEPAIDAGAASPVMELGDGRPDRVQALSQTDLHAAKRKSEAIEASGSNSAPVAEPSSLMKVQFVCDLDEDSWPDAPAQRLVVVKEDDGTSAPIVKEWKALSVETSLGPGSYAAALLSPENTVGPVARFEVQGEELTVKLQPLAPFNLVMTTVAHPTDEWLAGVDVALTRELPKGMAETDQIRHRTMSDGAGIARLVGLSRGTWTVTLNKADFAQSQFDIELPGQWLASTSSRDEADIGNVSLPAVTPLAIEIAGAAAWGGAGAFRVAHTAAGEQVPFNDAGRANLALGWFDEPLLLKLWYPGGQLGIIYLDAGLPEAGEPLVIDVTRNRGVEIDLQLTKKLKDFGDRPASELFLQPPRRGQRVRTSLVTLEGRARTLRCRLQRNVHGGELDVVIILLRWCDFDRRSNCFLTIPCNLESETKSPVLLTHHRRINIQHRSPFVE